VNRQWIRILRSPDDDAGGEAPFKIFGDAADDEEEIEVVMTTDGNLPPEEPAEPPAPEVTFEDRVATELARLQATNQQTQPGAGPSTEDLVKALRESQKPADPTPAPFDFEAYLKEQEDLIYKEPAKAMKNILEKYTQNVIAPSYNQIQQENQRLAAQVNKQTVSGQHKEVFEMFGDEIERKAQEYVKRGDPNSYANAVRDVSFEHQNEILDKKIADRLASLEKEKEVPPAANQEPGGRLQRCSQASSEAAGCGHQGR
jgi:hypothetical protein